MPFRTRIRYPLARRRFEYRQQPCAGRRPLPAPRPPRPRCRPGPGPSGPRAAQACVGAGTPAVRYRFRGTHPAGRGGGGTAGGGPPSPPRTEAARLGPPLPSRERLGRAGRGLRPPVPAYLPRPTCSARRPGRGTRPRPPRAGDWRSGCRGNAAWHGGGREGGEPLGAGVRRWERLPRRAAGAAGLRGKGTARPGPCSAPPRGGPPEPPPRSLGALQGRCSLPVPCQCCEALRRRWPYRPGGERQNPLSPLRASPKAAQLPSFTVLFIVVIR